jgi:hypothetical protein
MAAGWREALAALHLCRAGHEKDKLAALVEKWAKA